MIGRIGVAVTVVQSITPGTRAAPRALKILHCLRAPVGGLFRHVLDLAGAQAAAGHDVGIVCAAGGDALTEQRLAAIQPRLRLGLFQLQMARDLGLGDLMAWRQVGALASRLSPDVLHGHGAKGGAYARLAARRLKRDRRTVRCFYTPHGGSLHYAPSSLAGQIFGAIEHHLEIWTDGILFESHYAADKYAAQIGHPTCAVAVAHNGLLPHDFDLARPEPQAADFLFVGEMRTLKGVDVALEALALVARQKPSVRAVLVGDGPDKDAFKSQAAALGLGEAIDFPGAMPARTAFSMGRILLMPSRAESLPYVILEAAAAGIPVIATTVGGIPEILTLGVDVLVPPGDAEALARAMVQALAAPEHMHDRAIQLRDEVADKFSVAKMADTITRFYSSPRAIDRAA